MAGTYREMNDLEKKRNSLAAKTARAAVISGIVLITVALAIGLAIHGSTLVSQSTRHAFDIANYARMALNHDRDKIAVMADEVMEIYRGMTEEERSQTGTPGYEAYFSEVITENAGLRETLLRILNRFLESSEVDDVYLAMYDAETNTLVYLTDPQKENQFSIGEWEPVGSNEINSFLNWDGTGMLYDISLMDRYGWICTAGVPIENADGKVSAFILVDVTLENAFQDIMGYFLRIAMSLAVVIVAIIFFLLRYIRKELISPVNRITEAAISYAGDRQEGEKSHFASLDIHTGDELENLSLIMADMERELAEREEHIRTITAEKERTVTELRMARQIQGAMLPHVFPPFPDRKEFGIYATMDPAKEVGGDFYDFFLIDPDHLGLVMADVSGKGIPAALFMMISKVILQSCAMLGRTSAEILQKTNEALCSNNQVGMFVTVWVGILEISTGKIMAANAGHEFPAYYHKEEGSFELIKDKHGFVIGGMETAEYTEYELQMKPGDKIFLYTDGVPEASDSEDNMFGLEHMLEALNREPEAAPEQVLKNVKGAVDAFVRGAEQFDDLTMMCLEYNGMHEQNVITEEIQVTEEKEDSKEES